MAQQSPEVAQLTTEIGAEASSESIRDALAQMSDQEVRAMLLARLDSALALQSDAVPQGGLFRQLQELGQAAYSPFLVAIKQLPQTANTQSQAFGVFVQESGPQELAQLATLIGLALALGFAAEFITTRIVRRWRPAPDDDDTHALFKALRLTYQRFWREVVGLVVFASVASLVATVTMTKDQLSYASPLLLFLVALPRAAAVFSRFILSPYRPELRIVSVSDTWARFLYRHQIGLACVAGFALFLVAFNSRSGVAPGEVTVGYWLNFLVHLYIAWIAWTAREGLTDMMRGSDPDRTMSDERIARAYPFFAIIVSLSLWLVVNIAIDLEMFELLRSAPHLTTMFWLLMSPLIDTAIRGIVNNLNPEMMGEGQVAEKAYAATKRSYIRIGRVVAVGLVLLIIADAWDVDLTNLANAGLGLRIVAASLETILIIAVGYIVFELVSLWINRKLAREHTLVAPFEEDAAAGEGGGPGASRLSTVLPLLRSAAQIAIAVIFSLLAIGSLGIDITPLLAGFGVVGVAIGFGAQRLVSDVVAGIFF